MDNVVIDPRLALRHPAVRAVDNAGEPWFLAATPEDMTLFFGRNSESFLRVARRIGRAALQRFPLAFCWPALFLSFAWLAYRRMPVLAAFHFVVLAAFVVFSPQYVELLFASQVMLAVAAKPLYVHQSVGAVRRIRASTDTEYDRLRTIRRSGGVSVPALSVALVPYAAVVAVFLLRLVIDANAVGAGG